MNRELHRCARPGCRAMIKRALLMCLVDWASVPKGLRDEVWRTLAAWRADPSDAGAFDAYRQARAAAIRAVTP